MSLQVACRGFSSCRKYRSLTSRLKDSVAMRSMSKELAGSTCKVAVAQMTAVGSKDSNLETCTSLVKSAREKGCSMVFLPECFAFIGMSSEESLAESEALSGPTMQKYCALAKAHNMWLSLGGFHEKSEEDGHNTHVIVANDGSIVTSYRKIHLFDVDIPNGPILMESRHTRPGKQMVTCDSPAGRLGLSTCYDLRFPHLYQRLVLEGGARVLLVPSAFTKPTGEAHWLPLLRARAIENQAYVIAAAQAGRHNERRESYGHAVIIDPWGRVAASLGDPSATGIATAEIDHTEPEVKACIREFRLPLFQEHRGSDSYLHSVAMQTELEKIRTKMPVQQHRATALDAVVGGGIMHSVMPDC